MKRKCRYVNEISPLATPGNINRRNSVTASDHDDVIKWKYFPRYWPFVRGIHRSPVNSPHKGQRRGALMFSLICAWINGWVNNSEAGNLRRYIAHYYVTVMRYFVGMPFQFQLTTSGAVHDDITSTWQIVFTLIPEAYIYEKNCENISHIHEVA